MPSTSGFNWLLLAIHCRILNLVAHDYSGYMWAWLRITWLFRKLFVVLNTDILFLDEGYVLFFAFLVTFIVSIGVDLQSFWLVVWLLLLVSLIWIDLSGPFKSFFLTKIFSSLPWGSILTKLLNELMQTFMLYLCTYLSWIIIQKNVSSYLVLSMLNNRERGNGALLENARNSSIPVCSALLLELNTFK